jgi:chromosomal replication initiation ATPase DnaA
MSVRVPETIAVIIGECAILCHVHQRALMDISAHEAPVVAARRMAARRLRALGLSFAVIGKYLGGLHHTSVMHLCDPRKKPYQPDKWKLRLEINWAAREVPLGTWDEWI